MEKREERWERKGKNKLKPDGPGQIRGLIVCSSRRTCVNRSGSLAGCKSIRIFCHTTRLTFRSVPYCNPIPLLQAPSTSFFFWFYFYFSYFCLLIQYLRPLTQQQPPGRSFLTALNLLSALTVDSVIFPPSELGCAILHSLSPIPIIPNRSPSSKQHVSSLALRFPTPLPSHHRFRIRAIRSFVTRRLMKST